jgi:hypothetical protein
LYHLPSCIDLRNSPNIILIPISFVAKCTSVTRTLALCPCTFQYHAHSEEEAERRKRKRRIMKYGCCTLVVLDSRYSPRILHLKPTPSPPGCTAYPVYTAHMLERKRGLVKTYACPRSKNSLAVVVDFLALVSSADFYSLCTYQENNTSL